MIQVFLSSAGVALLLLYAAWWAGLLLPAAWAVERHSSSAFLGAVPFLGAGWLSFGLAEAWAPGAALGFVSLMAFVAVLFAGAGSHGSPLVPLAVERDRPLPPIAARPRRDHRSERDTWILSPRGS